MKKLIIILLLIAAPVFGQDIFNDENFNKYDMTPDRYYAPYEYGHCYYYNQYTGDAYFTGGAYVKIGPQPREELTVPKPKKKRFVPVDPDVIPTSPYKLKDYNPEDKDE